MGLADFKSVGGNFNCRGGFDSLPLRKFWLVLAPDSRKGVRKVADKNDLTAYSRYAG